MSESNLKEITQTKISREITNFIERRKSLQLASLNEEGFPFASYAPFAYDEKGFYVLLSEIALHAKNLIANPSASILIIEDEESANELFARIRVNYSVTAEHIEFDCPRWHQGISRLQNRHGDRIQNLSEHSDFKLFYLVPQYGRFVKGFGRAYSLTGKKLGEVTVNHLQDGHKKRGFI